MRDLETLRLVKVHREIGGESLGERPSSEGEHPGCFDAAAPNHGDVGGPAADVNEDGAQLVRLGGRAAARQGVGLGDRGHELEVQLLRDRLQRPDVRERSERVEHRDLHDVSLEVHRIADRVPVDAHRGDRAVDQLDVDLLDAEVVGHLADRFPERSPLHRLQRRGEICLGDACLWLRPRHGHGRAEAAHLLAGDADDRLTGDGLAHVLGFGQRAVAVVDDRLEVGDRARLHVRLRLTDLADPEDDALVVLPLDDQRLDELGADVEHGVVALELLAPLEERELSLGHQAACPTVSVMALRSRETAASRLAGSPTLPRPRSGRPPPLPPVISAAPLTSVPAWMPA